MVVVQLQNIKIPIGIYHAAIKHILNSFKGQPVFMSLTSEIDENTISNVFDIINGKVNFKCVIRINKNHDFIEIKKIEFRLVSMNKMCSVCFSPKDGCKCLI